MKKLKVSSREIGTVRVFDLEGYPTQETLQDIAWKIQRSIRRHRLQRVILNFQHLPELDPLGVRKILSACIRPQRSLIYGASDKVMIHLEESCLPKNMRICSSEKEVAEDLGPFLLEKDRDKVIRGDGHKPIQESIGYQMEQRRSKRMHVAIPLELKVFPKKGDMILTRAIATNISEGGLFAEYLDLDAAQKIEDLDGLEGLKTDIQIFKSDNFPEEYNVEGEISRKDLRKKQLGLAIRFTEA